MDSVPTEQEEAVQGELGLGTLLALVRRLHEEQRTGTLHIRTGESERRVHFKWGVVVFAGSDRTADRLDQLLRHEELVDVETLEEAQRAQESSKKRFGECLIDLGALAEDELLAAVERQVRAIVTFLFSLDRGYYRFEETEEPVAQDLVLDLPMQGIVLDGIRSMEDPIALQIGVGALTDFLHPGATKGYSNVNAAEGFVLSRVDGRTNILDVLSVSPLTEVETLRSVCALLAVGIVEAKPEPLEHPTPAVQDPPKPPVRKIPPKPEPTTVAPAVEAHRESSPEDKRHAAEQRFREGRRLFSQKKYHEAIGVLMEAIRLEGSKPSYHRLLGQAYAQNPKWRDSAIEHVEEAVRLDDYDDETHYLLGELYEQEGREQDAMAEFRKVVSLEPNHAGARQKLERPGMVSRLKSIFRKTSPR